MTYKLEDVLTPDMFNMEYENVQLVTKDKAKLYCYLVGRLQDLISLKELYHHGLVALTVEYRGYGHNKGVPGEMGIRLDAQAAVDYVKNHPILCKLPIILYGQGLGAAVAIYTASKNRDRISALIIENTYTSIPDLLRRPISWMCTQKRWSSSTLPRLPAILPILVLSGRMDEYLPYTHMDDLWNIARTRGRSESSKGVPNEEYRPPPNDMFKAFPLGSHYYTCDEPGYWETIFEFLDPFIVHTIT
ncbi:Protein bem46 [Psilocybe cubensis]|uniref:Protein bem46 n=1 Tax=Psilocybe cubensis TaxID=181762 RepID=A0ACB8GZZ4_PSICU|nr:Protein bem46 [Psilocybe cubensis]KAH9481012.1 Protein bem46 [Psilocybe cubensis]